LAGDYVPKSGGVAVHAAAKTYRQAGALVLPLSRIVTTNGFRAIGDTTLSYCEAGSFVAFLVERFGMARVLTFFRASTRDDALATIEQRFSQVFGLTLDEAQAAWLGFIG
jgi:hypothetical protein